MSLWVPKCLGPKEHQKVLKCLIIYVYKTIKMDKIDHIFVRIFVSISVLLNTIKASKTINNFCEICRINVELKLLWASFCKKWAWPPQGHLRVWAFKPDKNLAHRVNFLCKLLTRNQVFEIFRL